MTASRSLLERSWFPSKKTRGFLATPVGGDSAAGLEEAVATGGVEDLAVGDDAEALGLDPAMHRESAAGQTLRVTILPILAERHPGNAR
jgi:hypothetical protein